VTTKRLIVSGDDFGLDPAINAGVVAAHREGLVSAASLVACGAAFDDAVRLARETPSLDIGVHLTLVEEKPLLEGLDTLAPGGRFPRKWTAFFARLLSGRIRFDEIERELTAQVRRVVDAGLRVTHVDSHQHVHFFPGVAEIALRVAAAHGIGAIRAGDRAIPRGTRFSALLGPLGRRLRRKARALAVRSPDTLLLPVPSGRVTASRLAHLLAALPDGVTELALHPGADQASLDARYPAWSFAWEDELNAARSTDARRAFESSGASLCRFADL
jgi:predicted glycoside hydrolase/deacetylase ChbG (UPF0249 family)